MPDDQTNLSARIDALEIRVAYQDETIDELNAALATHWQEIEKLRRQVTLLEAELREAAEGAVADAEGAPEPPPPHY
ncbi:MAG TPA: SlyX family protein [Devosia sp.]|nr:SlyX family protein [Devosia sp.]